MIVRYLPLILILFATILTLAPTEAAARDLTQGAPTAADLAPKTALPADRQARLKTGGAPIDSPSAQKSIPPAADSREVRPAQAFPPERIDRTLQVPTRAGVDTPDVSPKDDPRSVEERKDPGD
jgi:hypothetical protein